MATPPVQHTAARVVVTRALPGRVNIPGADVVMAPANPQLTRAELLAFVRGAQVVIAMFHDRVDEEFLDAAGPNLRGVCHYAVGMDNIDVEACARRKIVVTNTPDAVTEGTANMAWGLALAVARRIVEADRFCRSGAFEHEGNTFPTGWCGAHFTNQQMLIVGAGRIGRAVALRARTFGMNVLYVSRSRHAEFERAPISGQWIGLDEGLTRADIVSLHTPLTPATRHLLDARRLALLKPTAILINTSRGQTVDESALVEALRHNRLLGAGLDVFEHEPTIHPGLRALTNVVMTPHIGSAEQYWREQMTAMVSENARAILAGKTPPNVYSHTA